MPIRILNETTINQIAAGEVVENASSVVKELVENSVDAEASEVYIETRAGGRAEIRVSDNGSGMNADDLLLSVERHATSKIIHLEDLNSISSLGFRGEALPSIASVSKMSLESKGSSLPVVGGRIGEMRQVSNRKGTTIEVKSLFFNVPVRKKFQKSLSSENAAIHKVLIQMALCHPGVKFAWRNDGEEQFSVDGPLFERIQTLLGEEFAEAMIPVEQFDQDIQLSGFIGRPSSHRPNRMGQYLFINERPVISPFIAKRILEGYSTRIPTHRYPLFVLHLSLPSSWIDVNVHPQKREVRIRKEEKVGPFLVQAVETSLQQSGKKSSEEIEIEFPDDLKEVSFFEMPEPYHHKTEYEELSFSFKRRIITKMGGYALLEDERGVCIVDGMRARSRIIFEHLMSQKEKRSVQRLLIPINLEFSGAEKTLLMEHLEKLDDLGIGIRHFGGETFIVDAIPSLFEMEEVTDFIHAFLEDPNGKIGKMLARSLHRSVSSFEQIVEKLFQCDQPYETPDGKATTYLLTQEELKKKFDEAH